MAIEYRLSYTASDIDKKLGKIDTLSTKIETKQDKLVFDSTPTVDSNNPVTSGGVFSALNTLSEDIPNVPSWALKSEKPAYTAAEVGAATEGYVNDKIAEMVDSAPETLDTLNKLSAALGDDSNFAATVAEQIGKKIDKVEGMGLSSNDFTDEEKKKLANLTVGGNNVEISSDLTLPDVAAEAKAVGDALDNATKVEQFSVELGANGTMGGYKTGDVIAEGTSVITILNKLLRKAVPATYTKATLSLSNNGGTASGNIEAGSTVTPKLRASFTKNDAGGLTSINIKQGSTVVASGTTTPLDYSGSSIVIGDNTITFTASADYSDAPVKNNNLGDESKENWFAGGTATSSSYSITGKRQLFYGTGAGALPTITSDVVRGLSGKKLAPANGNSFNIEVAEGQQHIIFAYPASLRDATNITYVNANDPNMLANFTKSEIQVADARGGTNGLANYKVYTYAMEVQAAAAMTFKVTI